MNKIPKFIDSELMLDDLLSQPYQSLVELFKILDGDIMILGIAGKMGITLGMTAIRAIKQAGSNAKVIGVSRFSNSNAKKQLDELGIETIKCDLLNRDEVDALPKVKNIIFMAGKKFGTGSSENLTWAMNVVVPTNVAHAFKDSRIVVFSTGCVYPLKTSDEGGCSEKILPAPIGDYAQSALGRERVFSYYSEFFKTPICIYRLNYALDLRYGVIYDIAEKILNNKPIDLTTSYFNAIWQGDANNRALLCLAHCESPALALNVSGVELLSVKTVAKKIAKLFNKKLTFTGTENGPCYLTDVTRSMELFGKVQVDTDSVINWQADWLLKGQKTFGKPTHFEVTNGKF